MTVKRDDWKNQPLPETRVHIVYARSFDEAEHTRITWGLEPQEMEDKWFIFYEAPWLFFHRSWTGICIYAVCLRAEGEGSAVEEVLVNRAPEQYRETDNAHDVQMLAFLIDALLLGRDVAFPIRNKDLPPEKASLLKHHVVGHGRSKKD